MQLQFVVDIKSISTKLSAVLASVLSIAAFVTLVVYYSKSEIELNFGGGFNSRELIFNYHPVFMVLGLVVCYTHAILPFRYVPIPREMQKLIHGGLHSLTVVFIIVGLTIVICSNNYLSLSPGGVLQPNIYTIHSFVGLAAIALYMQNYFFGLFYYYLNYVSLPMKQTYMPSHKFYGCITLFLVMGAVLTGIQEEFTGNGCYYTVTSPIRNPEMSYGQLSLGCRYLNAVGILVICAVFFAVYAVLEVKSATPTDEQSNNSLGDLNDLPMGRSIELSSSSSNEVSSPIGSYASQNATSLKELSTDDVNLDVDENSISIGNVTNI